MSNNSGQRKPISAATYVWAAVLAATVGFTAVYVSRAPCDNATVGATPAPAAGAPATPSGTRSPLATGEMTAFVFKKTPEEIAEVKFADRAGRVRTLAEWKGKVVLLNLWATWCGPCRKEMPSLDRLQKEVGSDRFEVVALAVDRSGADSVIKFLDNIKVANLTPYFDATTRAGSALRAVGLPTTILIDKEGREIGRLSGPAEWDSADAKRLVQAHVER